MDEEPESFIEKMTREMRLALDVEGGRVFVHHADADNIDPCTIELKCRWSPGLLAMFDTSVLIGEDKHRPLMWDEDGVQVADQDADEVIGWSLYECAIMLSLYRVDEKWMDESATKNDGKPILGRFRYYAPIQTSDGLVNDRRPTVSAWVGVGHDNFELIRARLLATDTPDFDLGIDVEFPRGTVEAGWTDKNVKWDGKDSIPVSAAVIEWKRGDWNSETDRIRERFREPEAVEYTPPREHLQLMGSMERLEVAVRNLALPVWLAVAAAIIALIVRY